MIVEPRDGCECSDDDFEPALFVAMGESGEDSDLGGLLRLEGVVDDGECARSQDEGAECGLSGSEVDRTGCPPGDALTGTYDEHGDVASQLGAQRGGIEGPGEALVVVSAELDLEDDAVDGLVVE